MMRSFKAMLCACLLALPGAAVASAASHRAAADRLLATLHARTLYRATMRVMLDTQLEQHPQLRPYKAVMARFFRRYMGYASIRPVVVNLYVKHFTEKELDRITAFYATPTGQKAARLMPQLERDGAEVGARRVRAHLGELRAMIQAEARRLQSREGGAKVSAEQ